MLALMSTPSHLPDFHSTTLPTISSNTSNITSTMSVALLPSAPMPHISPLPSLYPSQPSLAVSPPSKRPKLSLNTSNITPSFGKKTTSLRLETLSATSPTLRNTFRNSTEPKIDASTPINLPLSDAEYSSSPPSSSSDALSISSTVSTPSVATAASSLPEDEPPYKLQTHLPSILINSPLSTRLMRSRKRSNSCTSDASLSTEEQTQAVGRVAKKVCFRAPLTEEIFTTRFTWKHSDIDVEADSISTLELDAVEGTDEDQPRREVEDNVDSRHAERDVGHEEQSASNASYPEDDVRCSESTDDGNEDRDDTDRPAYPATPVAGRQKRHRIWTWTLGPIESAGQVAHDEPVRDEAEKDEKVEAS